ncbi:MAG: hypothetical protein KDH96_01360 [Candidatus Riesia sp.]|nr:hypothetical protein [Candidatus Riesia sp.]
MNIEIKKTLQATINEKLIKEIVVNWMNENRSTYMPELLEDITAKDIRIGCQIDQDYNPHDFIVEVKKTIKC